VASRDRDSGSGGCGCVGERCVGDCV
jgi:hypothetical protein